MRAETVEMQREDAGRLLVPMVHVERSLLRQTTIVSVEVPEEAILRCRNEIEFRALIASILDPLAESFVDAWHRYHPKDP